VQEITARIVSDGLETPVDHQLDENRSLTFPAVIEMLIIRCLIAVVRLF